MALLGHPYLSVFPETQSRLLSSSLSPYPRVLRHRETLVVNPGHPGEPPKPKLYIVTLASIFSSESYGHTGQGAGEGRGIRE